MTIELPAVMRAMVTEGHGGLDKIVLHEDWPRPDPSAGEVLIRVGACGLNNTDVNTRSGWYSKAVSDATTGDAFGVECIARCCIRNGLGIPTGTRVHVSVV